MKPRGRHSSPTIRDRRGIPIVQPSPSRSLIDLTESSIGEEEQDEIQLCKVPVKQSAVMGTMQQQQQQQRSQLDQFNRAHQPPSVASSPRLDSWQDASTEPITPYNKGDVPINPIMTSPPPQRQPKKQLFAEPNSPNPIEAPPSRLFLSANLKRKAEDSESPSLPAKKLSRLSAQQKQKFDLDTPKPVSSVTAVNASRPNTGADTFSAHRMATPIPEPKIHVLRDKEPVVKEDTKKGEDVETKDGNGKSEEENRRLTKEEEAARVAEEISHLMKNVKNLANYYKLVDKIGEGTFSTVYKAVDIRRDYYDNKNWAPHLLTSPTNEPTNEDNSTNAKSITDYVALKRIYHTSSPRRIATEIAILKLLRGNPCISPLITAFRQQDQVFVVMPYIPHDDFKRTFSTMYLMDIKYYLKSLFTALSHLHHLKILHRDVKPNNFLFSRKRKTGYLIDFGLAEHQDDSLKWEAYIAELEAKSQNDVFLQSSRAVATSAASTSSVLAALTNKESRAPRSAVVPTTGTTSADDSTPTPSTSNSTSASKEATEGLRAERRTVGYVRNDARHQVRANRAGTRGFRAPEILMRVTRQTAAIDVWSAGVILLSFMTGRYPFFIANDESDAVVELAQIFGVREMVQCAAKYNRNFSTNIHLPKERLPFSKLCVSLNRESLSRWEKQDIKEGLDLLERTLDLNCSTRITASEALKHPFLNITQEKINLEKKKEEVFRAEDAKRAEEKAKEAEAKAKEAEARAKEVEANAQDKPNVDKTVNEKVGNA